MRNLRRPWRKGFPEQPRARDEVGRSTVGLFPNMKFDWVFGAVWYIVGVDAVGLSQCLSNSEHLQIRLHQIVLVCFSRLAPASSPIVLADARLTTLLEPIPLRFVRPDALPSALSITHQAPAPAPADMPWSS